MKRIALIILAVMLTASLAGQSYAQGTLAPLYLSTNGDGSITPLQSGQLLEVGQSYNITATPDSGFSFSSWQPLFHSGNKKIQVHLFGLQTLCFKTSF